MATCHQCGRTWNGTYRGMCPICTFNAAVARSAARSSYRPVDPDSERPAPPPALVAGGRGGTLTGFEVAVCAWAVGAAMGIAFAVAVLKLMGAILWPW